MDNAGNNERPTLGREIEHIKFPNLTYLHLEGNNIQSLETFDFIIAPNLAHLFLRKSVTTQTTTTSYQWQL
jgi:hypothetical protein